ncbi:transporter [Nevskia ramosa]|uniref:transporter n=1 Tax=Nevskia ramosa TaxID=64002 RepID=UPI0003B45318|nr:transporter [Nevskia ramosa]
MRGPVLLASLLSCLPAQSLLAQDREDLPASLFSWAGRPATLGPLGDINTDRPDFTDASSTVGLGVLQLETGYTFTKASGTESHSWGEPMIRYGVLANWIELRMAVAPVTERSTTTRSGIEDLSLGVKLTLMQQDGLLPGLAVVPQMTVPTGSAKFSADRVLPGINLLYGWDLSDALSMDASTHLNLAVDDDAHSYTEWAQSLSLGLSLTENLSSFFEWYALFPVSSATASIEHYLDVGLTCALSGDLQIDLRVGRGLNDASDDYFVGTGLAFRFK